MDDTDWQKMGVIRRGTFNQYGWPTGWWFLDDVAHDGPLMKVVNGDVYLRGEFNQELTDECKACMGELKK